MITSGLKVLTPSIRRSSQLSLILLLYLVLEVGFIREIFIQLGIGSLLILGLRRINGQDSKTLRTGLDPANLGTLLILGSLLNLGQLTLQFGTKALGKVSTNGINPMLAGVSLNGSALADTGAMILGVPMFRTGKVVNGIHPLRLGRLRTGLERERLGIPQLLQLRANIRPQTRIRIKLL